MPFALPPLPPLLPRRDPRAPDRRGARGAEVPPSAARGHATAGADDGRDEMGVARRRGRGDRRQRKRRGDHPRQAAWPTVTGCARRSRRHGVLLCRRGLLQRGQHAHQAGAFGQAAERLPEDRPLRRIGAGAHGVAGRRSADEEVAGPNRTVLR